MSDCPIEGCARSVHARGWCATHYYRWRVNGDPLVSQKPRGGTVCAVTDCGRNGSARGFCKMHAERIAKHGSPFKTKNCKRGSTPEQRLRHIGWTVTQSGCWEFAGSRNRDGGYGHIGFEGKIRGAHRMAYEAWIGPLIDGMVIMHLCDNPPCINPEHLRQGTQEENQQDALRKGRR